MLFHKIHCFPEYQRFSYISSLSGSYKSVRSSRHHIIDANILLSLVIYMHPRSRVLTQCTCVLHNKFLLKHLFQREFMRLKMFTFSLSVQIHLSHIIKISQLPECCWQFYFNNIKCLLKLTCERWGLIFRFTRTLY